MVESEDRCFFCGKTSWTETLYLIRHQGRTEGMCEECYRTKLRGKQARIQ